MAARRAAAGYQLDREFQDVADFACAPHFPSVSMPMIFLPFGLELDFRFSL